MNQDYTPMEMKYELLKIISKYGGQNLQYIVSKFQRSYISFNLDDEVMLAKSLAFLVNSGRVIMDLTPSGGNLFYISPREKTHMTE